jgi:hypothetical protein
MGGGPATAKIASYVLVAADAGTTVAMNAAGATTITVNTGLFSAGDTVFIQNLGAGACTVTAGTATVATVGSLILPQNDAGILYFTATGAAIFYEYGSVSGTYATYTPTLTGITVGNGTTTARFSQIGKVVNGSVKFTLGSTSSITGGIIVSLPTSVGGVVAVTGSFTDNGAGAYGLGYEISGSDVYLRALNASGTYLTYTNTSATVPFTWGNTDFFEFQFTYQAA